ncbi:prisilkin-39 [Drosophila busckii]|uniref:prisilkin-39 n=1 Tax=Drosophila busckii TaxID=30019 RepID=UPI00083ECB2B|nr:prisilkin-39 [Drosophila busckii]
MQLNLAFSLLLLALLAGAQSKPTFGKIAEVMLDVLDGRHHYQPAPVYRPPHGPLIQEGYEHGYDYYYGGGGGAGYAQPPPAYVQPAPYGYYPSPAPVKGYQSPPQHSYGHEFGHEHGYEHGYDRGYAHGYGGGAAAAGPTIVGGYKQQGY